MTNSYYAHLRDCVKERMEKMKKGISPALGLTLSCHEDNKRGDPTSHAYFVVRHEKPSEPPTAASGFNPKVYFLPEEDRILIRQHLAEAEPCIDRLVKMLGHDAYSVDGHEEEYTGRQVAQEMLAPLNPTKFVVFVDGVPGEFRDSQEEAEELLRQRKLGGDVKEVADGEFLCPGCYENKLVYVYHARGGGHMGCPQCGKVWMS